MAQAVEGRGGLGARAQALERRQAERPAQERSVDLAGRLDEVGIPECDGSLDFDWRSYVGSTPTALGLPLFAGERFNAQGWFRDPAAPGGANLTDALEFEVLP